MSYIAYLNGFNRWLGSNALEPASQLLYFRLLDVFNCAGWPESVQVDNQRIMSMTGQHSEKSAIAARDRLISARLISYQRGKKGSPGRYALLPFPCIKYSENNTVENIHCISGQFPVSYPGGNREVNPALPLQPYKDREGDGYGEGEYPPNPPAGGTGPVAQVPVENAPSPTTEEPSKRKRGTRRNDPSRSPELTPDEEATLMGYSPGLCAAVRDWFQYKAERREMYGATFRRTFFGKIAENAPKYGADAVAKLITDSLSYGWKGVMWEKLAENGGGYGRKGGRYANGNGGYVAGGSVGAKTGGNAGGRAGADENRWGTDFQNW